jgi:hypothetical protein
MKLIKELPFVIVMQDQSLDVAIWQPEPGEPFCEYTGDQLGACDTSGISYGTDDPHAPIFCARHFYQRAVAGDGVSTYALADTPAVP